MRGLLHRKVYKSITFSEMRLSLDKREQFFAKLSQTNCLISSQRL